VAKGTSLPIYLAKVVRNFVVDFYRAKKSREEAVGGAAEIEALLDPQEETLSSKASWTSYGVSVSELGQRSISAIV